MTTEKRNIIYMAYGYKNDKLLSQYSISDLYLS